MSDLNERVAYLEGKIAADEPIIDHYKTAIEKCFEKLEEIDEFVKALDLDVVKLLRKENVPNLKQVPPICPRCSGDGRTWK